MGRAGRALGGVVACVGGRLGGTERLTWDERADVEPIPDDRRVRVCKRLQEGPSQS